MLRIGIIGCGKIAQVRHIPEYQENPNTEVAGYYDLNQERASALANQFGGKAYKSLDELLANPEIDAVSVCVANIGHAEASIKALQAGNTSYVKSLWRLRLKIAKRWFMKRINWERSCLSTKIKDLPKLIFERRNF